MKSSRTFFGRSNPAGSPGRSFVMVALVAVVFTVGVLIGMQYSVSQAQGGVTLPDEVEPAFEALYQTYNLIESQYIEDVPVETLVNGAITGMVEALGDQYSSYANSEEFPYVNDLSGQIEGIGVTISLNEETQEIEIVNVLPETPAEEAGIQAGDIFVAVNGEEVTGFNTLQLASRVRGPAGTTVDITLRRGDDLVELTVERARIEIINVQYEMLENNIGYVQLIQFSANAREQMAAAISDLQTQEMNGLIIDLRNNGGGLLTAATEVASLLLDEGVILIEQFGNGDEHIFKVEDGVVRQIFADDREAVYTENAGYAGVEVPIVILVNERSASASELVSGTWQDQGVATIIGTTTFGKGTVQTLNQLVNGGGVRLTIARWLTPNGFSITDTGVTPDIVVEMPELAEGEELPEGVDPQLDAAVEFLLDAVAEGQ